MWYGPCPDPPITRDGASRVREGGKLGLERVRNALRCIAILNYMAQDSPDLLVATRILSQQMSKPTEGTGIGVTRDIRYLQGDPRAAVEFGSKGVDGMVRV